MGRSTPLGDEAPWPPARGTKLMTQPERLVGGTMTPLLLSNLAVAVQDRWGSPDCVDVMAGCSR